ncbi:MAG: hypothetical protein KDD40_06405, partial [Bdellovibrionales bacterium]|nr:hypothetical protein [Bdellovibrionales bacterium]
MFVTGCKLNQLIEGKSNSVSTPDNPPAAPTTKPPYLLFNSGEWGSYVLPDGNACNPTTDTDCIHSGELIGFETDVVSSCSQISAVDNLNVFDWSCKVISGTKIQVYSLGFKSGKGLIDLIDGLTWREISIQILKNSLPISTSDSTPLWSRTIASMPAGNPTTVTSLNQENIIYKVDTTLSSAGYNINADNVSIVMAPGAKLNLTATTNNCNL